MTTNTPHVVRTVTVTFDVRDEQPMSTQWGHAALFAPEHLRVEWRTATGRQPTETVRVVGSVLNKDGTVRRTRSGIAQTSRTYTSTAGLAQAPPWVLAAVQQAREAAGVVQP